MTIRTFLLAGAALAALPGTASAQGSTPAPRPWNLHDAIGAPANLRLSGSVRGRYEALSGQFRPGLDESDDLFTFRTIVFAEYDAGPIRIGAELIDSRAYGGGPGSAVGTGEVNALELAQAYVGADLGDALGRGSTSTLELGRFTMEIGSQRLAGRNNFRNTTNAFTGARFQYRSANRTQFTAFYTLPHRITPSDRPSLFDNEVEWDEEGFDLTFWGGFLTLPSIAGRTNLDLFIFGLDEDDTPTRATRDRQNFTPGLRVYRDPRAGEWDYEFEGAYQFGRIRTGTGATAPSQDVSAYFLHAEVGRQFRGPWSPRVAFEYDLATGDRPGGNFTRFDSLYGPRRFDYGPTGIYGPLGRANISSPGVRVELKPSARVDAFVFYRAAWLDSATDTFASSGLRDPSGQSGRFAGHQVEWRARYWLVPSLVRTEFGGAVLFNGRFIEQAPNATRNGNTVYGYADITFNF